MSRSMLYCLAGAFLFQIAMKLGPELPERESLKLTSRVVAKVDPTKRPSPPRGLPMAMVLIRAPALPVTDLLREALEAARPLLPFASDLTQEGDTLTFNLDDSVVAISLVRAPIVTDDLELACPALPDWPNACPMLRAHGAQLVVALTASYLSPLDRALQLTQVTAAGVGDEVVIIGAQDGSRISPEEVAAMQRAARVSDLALEVRGSVARVYLGAVAERDRA